MHWIQKRGGKSRTRLTYIDILKWYTGLEVEELMTTQHITKHGKLLSFGKTRFSSSSFKYLTFQVSLWTYTLIRLDFYIIQAAFVVDEQMQYGQTNAAFMDSESSF